MEPNGALTGGGVAIRLLAVVALVLLNAFFVAAEFALVAARRSRIDEMVAHGQRGARSAQRALDQLDRYLSGTQLGITIASLGLGWLGEESLASLIDAGFRMAGQPVPSGVAHTAAALTVAFALITFLHIVLGEIAPKSVALVNPERLSTVVARPLMVFSWLFWPVLWLLHGSARALVRALHIPMAPDRSRAHSAEELRSLVVQARAYGTLNETDSAMLAGVFDFHRKKARDVMRPRTEVVAIPIGAGERVVWETARRERYSRYPVYRDDLDDVIGVFLAKDLWLHTGGTFVLAEHVRDVLFIPDSRLAERVLDDLRKSRAHMAVVLDEYGGTAGILTMEDLIEEVIGDIADEYDATTRTSLEADGVLELAGDLSLLDVRSDHRLAIPEGEWTTLGGFAFARLGRLPRLGDRVRFPGGELEVVAMDGRRVAALRVLRRPLTADGASRGTGTSAPRLPRREISGGDEARP